MLAIYRAHPAVQVQRALWDTVTPELRGVTLKAVEPTIGGRFIFDHAPTLEERDLVACAETEVMADFEPSIDVRFVAVSSIPPAPRDVLPGEEWIYARREPSSHVDQGPRPSRE